MKFAHRILVLTILLACGASLSAQGAVTASLDRNQLAPGETVQLHLQHEGSTDSQPNLDPLKHDFDVLGSSSGSSVQIINGHTSSQTQVNVVLAPRHNGKIQIPPLQWDGQQSAPLELTVRESGAAGRHDAAAPADKSHIFLTATLGQKQPYVQSTVVLTVRLYADQPLYQASLSLPAGSDVLVKQLDKGSQTSEMRNGRNYQVFERKYLLFPQRSGKLSLEGPVLDAQVRDAGNDDPFGNDPFFANAFKQIPLAGMVTATRPLHLRAKPVELNVLPRPAGATGANWLPAQKVTLEESWRPEITTIHVGEPLTRHLHVAALGLTGAQLPDLSTLMPVPDGIKAYPDQPRIEDIPQGDMLLGSRDQDIALIAKRPGQYTLPAVRLDWWDTTHNVQHEVVLPAHTLNILPAAGGTVGMAAPPPANPQSSSIPPSIDVQASTSAHAIKVANIPPWPWISLGLGLLWLGTIVGWWHSRRRVPNISPSKTDNEKPHAKIPAGSAFKSFQRACFDNDPHTARQHLLAWAGTVWPSHPPLGLNELSRRLDDAKLHQALRQLERACYSTDSTWHGESLAHSWPTPSVPATYPENKHALPELYH
ncbi:MAG TPA: BatD family protein [Sulfuricella sp.]|nr:BatD family protein [Sulfuricella sp.]